MPSDATDPVANPKLWAEVEDAPGWLLLLEAAGETTTPRLVVNDQDAYFLKATVKGLWPGKKVKFLLDQATGRKYLLREA